MTDPILKKFLDERGLEPFHLALVGARWDANRRRILFPRYGRDGGQEHPSREVQIVGWKVRDLSGPRPVHRYEPAGISACDTWPLIFRNPSPASSVFICEGETDTMRLAGSSIPSRYDADVICAAGSRHFPTEWIPFVRSYERAWVVADADDAGLLLTQRVGGCIPGVRSIRLPRKHDVCSFFIAYAEADFEPLVESAPIVVPTPPRVSSHDGGRVQRWSSDREKYPEKLTLVVARDVELRPRGNEFVGKCPFHDDSSPSFSVNPEKGLWQCFGCSAGGDTVDFVRKMHDLSYRDAVEYVKEIK